MSTSGSQSASSTCDVSGGVQEDISYPLWKFVTKGERIAGVGNYSWKCSFCEDVRYGSYTRVKAHLLGISEKGSSSCPKMSIQDLVKLRNLENDSIARKNSTQQKIPQFPNEHFSSHSSGASSMPSCLEKTKKRKSDNPIIDSFNVQARNHLDGEIARMFYTGGLPFNLAKNPYYVRSYTYAATNSIPGYVPPGYNKLRTMLLQQEKENVDRLLEPIRSSWKEKRVSIVSDGWSDSQRRPLINVMVSCESGPMFIKVVDCSGEVKGKEFIANLLCEVIDETGHHNVVQVIIDNASNCKGAGALFEGRYPHIFWTPCVVHTLNLALKNICAAKNTSNNEEVYDECHWITEIHADAVFIKNYIMNHSMRLAIFNNFSSLKLLSVADTRFASIVVMLKKIRLLKTAFQSMVVSDAWTTYKDDNRGQATLVRDKVLDEYWWSKVDYILDFTRPIYDMIRECDTDRSSLYLVYEKWEVMAYKVKKAIFKYEHKEENENSTFYNVVVGILTSRWSKTSTPLHSLAHSLNPRFYSQEWINEILDRIPPHVDGEFSTQRGHDLFQDLECVKDMVAMEPKYWWATYGCIVPTLQSLAFKLLGQPSSSCCERNWSIYKFIHSCAKNRLTPQRAEDLVRIHNNLRLLSRNSEEYIKGRTKMWDVGGDEHDNLEDVGLLAMAQLSLDEPEMESVVFDDVADIS